MAQSPGCSIWLQTGVRCGKPPVATIGNTLYYCADHAAVMEADVEPQTLRQVLRYVRLDK